MSRHYLLPVAGLAMIFAAATAFAANDLTVNPDAAIVGVYGLEVLVDGSTNSAYVADSSPADEKVYRLEFRIRHNSLAMDTGTGHLILLGRRGEPSLNNIRIFIKELGSPPSYKITARVKKDGAGTANCGKFTMGSLGSRVGLEWAAASAPGANDGFCRLLKNGGVQFENLSIDNDTLEVDNVRFGVPQGVSANTTGSYYLDEFSSFRTLSP